MIADIHASSVRCGISSRHAHSHGAHWSASRQSGASTSVSPWFDEPQQLTHGLLWTQLTLRCINVSSSAFLAVSFSSVFFDNYALVETLVLHSAVLMKVRVKQERHEAGESSVLFWSCRLTRSQEGFIITPGLRKCAVLIGLPVCHVELRSCKQTRKWCKEPSILSTLQCKHTCLVQEHTGGPEGMTPGTGKAGDI